jgi:hypothetical protein
MCTRCPDTAFTNTSNLAACVARRNCENGFIETQAPSLTSDRVCALCTSGSWQDLVNERSCKTTTTCALRTEFQVFAPRLALYIPPKKRKKKKKKKKIKISKSKKKKTHDQ